MYMKEVNSFKTSTHTPLTLLVSAECAWWPRQRHKDFSNCSKSL